MTWGSNWWSEKGFFFCFWFLIFGFFSFSFLSFSCEFFFLLHLLSPFPLYPSLLLEPRLHRYLPWTQKQAPADIRNASASRESHRPLQLGLQKLQGLQGAPLAVEGEAVEGRPAQQDGVGAQGQRAEHVRSPSYPPVDENGDVTTLRDR